MKFAFIENRYKTYFWAAVADQLQAFGHKVAWLVQNPIFSPSNKKSYVIPFPKKKDLNYGKNNIPDALHLVKAADRYVNYFGGDTAHYAHYQQAISCWIEIEQPDVVIGESTLFHELIAITECKHRGIPYFNPSMPGYPGGRFSVYAYATKEPLGNSKDELTDDECMKIAESIRKRENVPYYMIPPTGKEPERTYPLPRSFQDRSTILRGYWIGERFNTPSPWKKWHLDRRVVHHLKTWQAIEKWKTAPSGGKKIALYPLQMQPEANLDVWGQKYRDQTQLITQFADALPNEWHLWIKANPKSKYELSSGLMDTLRNHPKVFPVPLTANMAQTLPNVDMVCTVTGTISIECVLSKKPLVQLGPSIVPHGPGCTQLNHPSEISVAAKAVNENRYENSTDISRIQLIRRLYRTTFPGKVSDPVNTPSVMAADNIRSVATHLTNLAIQFSPQVTKIKNE